ARRAVAGRLACREKPRRPAPRRRSSETRRSRLDDEAKTRAYRIGERLEDVAQVELEHLVVRPDDVDRAPAEVGVDHRRDISEMIVEAGPVVDDRDVPPLPLDFACVP